MDNLKLISKDAEPAPEDKKVIRKGMLAYHASKGHKRKEVDDYFSIVIKTTNAKTVGGIVVSFRWGAMHIETLWIDEALRNKGWGKRLIEEAEKEAVRRKCHLSYTDTFSWQAPQFYEKLGYTLFGKLHDYPRGNALSYYVKRLG